MADAAAVQQVIQALNVLYQDPDTLAKEKANAWLSDFQKSVSTELIDAPQDGEVGGAVLGCHGWRLRSGLEQQGGGCRTARWRQGTGEGRNPVRWQWIL